MKQVLIRKGKVYVMEVPKPVAQPGCILVEVKYSLVSTGTELSSISHSSESLLTKARKHPEEIRKVIAKMRSEGFIYTIAKIKRELNTIKPTGYSCSGYVIDVGEGVKDLAIGDRVACAGEAYHVEVLNVPRNLVARIPEGCSLSDAASTTIGAIALQGIRRADNRLGEIVAVIGVGLIGQLTCQLLKIAGCFVIAVDPNQKRLEIVKNFGADYTFDLIDQSVIRRILFLTENRGVDSVIITAASDSNDIVQSAMEIVRKKGKVVIVGDVGLNLRRKPFYEKEVDFLISCSYGPGRYDEKYEQKGHDYPFAYVRWTENRNMEEYLKLLADESIKFTPLVTDTFPIEDAAIAYQKIKSGTGTLASLFTYGREREKKINALDTTIQIHHFNSSGRIRIALIGAGSFARSVHLPNLRRLSEQFAIHTIVDKEPHNARNVAVQFGVSFASSNYSDVLKNNDVDAVLIATRHSLHAKIAIDAAKAGKAIFLEKPMAMNKEELNKLVSVLRKTNIPFMVGYNRRFSPYATKVKTTLMNNTNPIMIIYRVNAGYIPLNHWTLSDEGGGRIVGEACHMFDFIRFLIGSPVCSVSVMKPSNTKGEWQKDNVITSLKYKNGSTATLVYTTFGSTKFSKERIEIFTDGKVYIIDDFHSLYIYDQKIHKERSSIVKKGYVEELEVFSSFLQGRKLQPISLDELEEVANITLGVDEQVANNISRVNK